MKTIKRKIVSGLIIAKDNKLFMGKKDPKGGGVYLGYWLIPGGGMEQGEDLLQALSREVMEESGIDISGYQIELVDDTGRGASERILDGEAVMCEMEFYTYKIFINDKNSDEIKIELNDDLAEYTWFNKEEFQAIPKSPPMEELISKIEIL